MRSNPTKAASPPLTNKDIEYRVGKLSEVEKECLAYLAPMGPAPGIFNSEAMRWMWKMEEETAGPVRKKLVKVGLLTHEKGDYYSISALVKAYARSMCKKR